MNPRRVQVLVVLWVVSSLFVMFGHASKANCAADTLTVIQRPLQNVPALVAIGDTLPIECETGPGAFGWAAELVHGGTQVPLQVLSSAYDPSTLWWTVLARVPDVPVYELYDLIVTADGGIADTTHHAVRVMPEFKNDYYFIHISDPHLPTELYYYEDGADTDTSCIIDLREIIRDVNIINPEFVVLTGDFINEGDLEDYLSRHYFTRAQALLSECEVPVFLTSGNHDIGGYSSTPVPPGTARQTWWRFFGWKRLDSPPPGAPWYTQNYSFNYGPVHYVGLEAYLNYDSWRGEIYGGQSFIAGQMQWLANDLAAAGSATKVLFFHHDFSNQINLNNLGVAMALSGHTHNDAGSITVPPYNLKTNNACRERCYRVIRVSNGVLHPSATITAGSGGNMLRAVFSPANNGTSYTVSATVTNNLNERFEHAQLRFLMPNVAGGVSVTGGTLLQIDDSGPSAVYYVGVDILASSSRTVTVTLDPAASVAGGDPSPALWLGPARPNPCRGPMTISFGLPSPRHVQVTVSDIQGREVAVLTDEEQPAGEHAVTWDGCAAEHRQASPGLYFVRLAAGDEVRIQKLLLVR